METINGNDLQARITSSIQSGSGADIIHALHNWPQLYAESLVDVSDVAEEVAKDQGGYYDIFPSLAKGDRGWLAVPWCALGILLCYRKSRGSTKSASRNSRTPGRAIAPPGSCSRQRAARSVLFQVNFSIGAHGAHVF